MYSIGEFSKLLGKSVKTLQRWDCVGKLKAFRHPSGRRYYTQEQFLLCRGNEEKLIIKQRTVVYCRVSNKQQKDDLNNQKEYINRFCLSSGLSIDDWYIDIGSGLNFNRKMFNILFKEIEKNEIKMVIIAHKDRLVRFGFDWFENFCLSHQCELKIINDDKLSPEQEMIQDLISIIHVFSCRIYGLRKYKKEIRNVT